MYLVSSGIAFGNGLNNNINRLCIYPGHEEQHTLSKGEVQECTRAFLQDAEYFVDLSCAILDYLLRWILIAVIVQSGCDVVTCIKWLTQTSPLEVIIASIVPTTNVVRCQSCNSCFRLPLSIATSNELSSNASSRMSISNPVGLQLLVDRTIDNCFIHTLELWPCILMSFFHLLDDNV